MMSPDQRLGMPPGKLWSLWDIMRRVFPSLCCTIAQNLARSAVMLNQASYPLPREDIFKIIDDCVKAVDDIHVSESLKRKATRMRNIGKAASDQEIYILIREFLNDFIEELTRPMFLMVSELDRHLYEQKTPPFGERVEAVFSTANKDIAAACRCFALDEWTASVFHLMRVLELGLRAFAEKVGLDQEAIVNENWKNIIDRVESKIRRIELESKSSEKAKKLQEYSAAAAQFRYFKDAWRNHVSHAHVSYDGREAEIIFAHVKAFIIQMAGMISEE